MNLSATFLRRFASDAAASVCFLHSTPPLHLNHQRQRQQQQQVPDKSLSVSRVLNYLCKWTGWDGTIIHSGGEFVKRVNISCLRSSLDTRRCARDCFRERLKMQINLPTGGHLYHPHAIKGHTVLHIGLDFLRRNFRAVHPAL